MDDGAIDRVVTICVAAAIGAILVCSLVIPVFSDMLGTLTANNLPNVDTGDLATWKTLIGLAVMMTIIGFVIAIIKGGLGRSR